MGLRGPVKGDHAQPTKPAGICPSEALLLSTTDTARSDLIPQLYGGEREVFLRAAERADREARTLCMTLAYGGCRLSEALALTADRIDLAGGLLLFESLKKRRRGIHRAVPVPPSLLDALDLVHGIRKLQSRRGKGRGVRLWPWSRMTGWRIVHRVMQDAGLAGPHASPKGLRHGFGVQAVSKGIALNMVQKWLDTPSSPRRQSMLTPSARRSKASPPGCGELVNIRIEFSRSRAGQGPPSR